MCPRVRGKGTSMSNGKIIFLDVDGTITNYENFIPQSCKDAIKRAR